jgi:hypothetical protein
MSKVILVDNSSIIHQSIFSWNAQKKRQVENQLGEDSFILPSNYSYFMSLISLLKRVGVDKKNDIIILAGDGRNSWRKAFDKNYKAQREDFRKSHELIDWGFHYKGIQKTIKQIDESTNFHIVWLSGMYNYLDLLNTEEGEKYLDVEQIDNLETEFGLEADDIISVATKFFNDKDCVVITKDADMEQLCVRENVKFFSMNVKFRGGTGIYKQVDNGYKILEKKVRLGDVSDNIIVNKENDTERDKDIRKLIIDLINLPSWVEQPITEILLNLPKKECNFDLLPFPNSLGKRFHQIYANDKIITVEDSIKREERKQKKAKNKKIKLKKQMTMRKTK